MANENDSFVTFDRDELHGKILRMISLSSKLFFSKAHATNPRKKIKGFYKPFLGASKMKMYYKPEYSRLHPSLHHYPSISRTTKTPINYMKDSPKTGYEYSAIYGDSTLELKNLPMCRTPEYMQERLRRFFSKFGRVTVCRALPHPLDPYQCEGTALVSFRDRLSSYKALKAPLKLPVSLQGKVIKMRLIVEDKRNDPDWHKKQKHFNAQLLEISKQLYYELLRIKSKPLNGLWLGIQERLFGSGKVTAPAAAIQARFAGDILGFFNFAECRDLFAISSNIVKPRLTSHPDRVFTLLEISLARKLENELAVPWREGRPDLPYFVERQIRKWDHLDKLPDQLQILSRNFKSHRVFDEKFLVQQKKKAARRKHSQFFRKEMHSKILEARKQKNDRKELAYKNRGGAIGQAQLSSI